MSNRKLRKSKPALRDARQMQEGFYQTLLENSFDGTAVIAFDGSVKYLSAPVKKILGYAKAIANVFTLLHPDDAKSFKKVLSDFKKKKENYSALTLRFKHKDGSWRYIAIRLK